jgi:hypothetical protein
MPQIKKIIPFPNPRGGRGCFPLPCGKETVAVRDDNEGNLLLGFTDGQINSAGIASTGNAKQMPN